MASLSAGSGDVVTLAIDLRPLWRRVAGWAYRSTSSRDRRLDLLRGFCVFAMVVDHIDGQSVFTPLTGGNQWAASAAEGFIFLSGLVMGIVYGARLTRRGWRETVTSGLRRAVMLYVVAVSLTLAFVALHRWTDIPLWLPRAAGLGVWDPSDIVPAALTLRYSYHGTDILVNYVLLVLLAPILLVVMRRGYTLPLMLGSTALWAVARSTPEGKDWPWEITNSGGFPPAIWQVLFVGGLTVGFHRDRVAAIARRVPAGILTALVAVGALAFVVLATVSPLDVYDPASTLFYKDTLAPGRLIAFAMAAGLAFQVTTHAWQPIVRIAGWLLLPLGQRTLFAYGAHLFLIGPAWEIVTPIYDSGPGLVLENSLRQGIVVLVIWGTIWLLWTGLPLIRQHLQRQPAVIVSIPAAHGPERHDLAA